ncbi:MAG: hypothetical protein M0R47_20450 [Methylobacter sp.]|jgi:hypothetical protein|uniref:hypothetical protein n=1 Tax=Methylobacter sp. TaxID=2051955 RepID=UPI0025FFB7D1|nr:hypothetical protein [Methylobacter sp.]MCK9622892.1 hypothetical protein [Methylobacter sp.]
MHKKLEELMNLSFDEFLITEADNILAAVSERNLCGRLSIVISRNLSRFGLEDYFVDPEYNRKQNGRIKTILDEHFEVVTINCDLILHSRGATVEEDNLIAIEMKKSNRSQKEKDNDRKRLRALTKASYDGVWSADGQVHPEHVCNYKLGYYIELNAGARTFQFEQYRNGQLQNEWPQVF